MSPVEGPVGKAGVGPAPDRTDLTSGWRELDRSIAGWWDGDMRTAAEQDIVHAESDWTWLETIRTIGGKDLKPPNQPTLLFLPFPFSPAAGNQGAYPEMFAWDSYFIVRGLLAHGRLDLARHILSNLLFLIFRFGKVLNANRTYFLTRSQPPLHPDAIWRCYEATRDRDLLLLAYPLLRREYTDYWNGSDHRTPTGLCTSNDSQDPYLRPELASIAEAGLDFSPVYEGDVRRCVPVALNSQLAKYAATLARISAALGFHQESEEWTREFERRAGLIRELCWNEREGFYLEYDFTRGRQLPEWSLCAYWTMWAGVATTEQAARLVENLRRFTHGAGLTFTDRLYPSPYSDFSSLQWSYPYCWPPSMVMVVDALQAYGFHDEARRVGEAYLGEVIRQYRATGSLWEKYIMVPGLAEDATERYENVPFHGWSSAAVAIIGRLIGLAESTGGGTKSVQKEVDS
jgi:alpha,alpha-trehalase